MNETGHGYSGTPETASSGSTETANRTNLETWNASGGFTETSAPLSCREIHVSERLENNISLHGTELKPMASQELAEAAHHETKQNMLAENGRYMSESQIKMLESNETKEHLTVMTSEEYTEAFPDVSFNALGHCDLEGNIYMKDISPEVISHVSTHETMHLCANRKNHINENGFRVTASGLRESTYNEDGTISDFNRGVNEGLTEMYTLRELQNRGDTASAYSVNSYSESRAWSERMEKLVGSEKTAAAYFGGKREELKQEFNRLNGNHPQAWENFSKDIDILEYSNDPNKIEQAKWRLMSQYSIMVHNKYGI